MLLFQDPAGLTGWQKLGRLSMFGRMKRVVTKLLKKDLSRLQDRVNLEKEAILRLPSGQKFKRLRKRVVVKHQI